jgi:hypothetical protein
LIYNDARLQSSSPRSVEFQPACSLRERQNAGRANVSSITRDLAVLTEPMQVCPLNMLLNKRLYSFVNATPASHAFLESSSRDTCSHDIFLRTSTVPSTPVVDA